MCRFVHMHSILSTFILGALTPHGLPNSGLHCGYEAFLHLLGEEGGEFSSKHIVGVGVIGQHDWDAAANTYEQKVERALRRGCLPERDRSGYYIRIVEDQQVKQRRCE